VLPKIVMPVFEALQMTSEQINVIPREIFPHADEKIWITIELKNTGLKPWPKGLKLYHMSGLESSDKLFIPSLNPGDKHKITLMFENPRSVGKFASTWQLGYEDKNELKTIGENIALSFVVNEEKAEKGSMKAIPNKAVVENIQAHLPRALVFQELFPKLSLETISDVLRKNPKVTDEDIVNILLSF
jgi:hypothetical protein